MAKLSLLLGLCLLICVGQSEASRATPQPEFSLRKCLDDVAVEYRCVSQITVSFWLPSSTIDEECCKVVDEFNKDCSKVVYAPLQSPILQNALKNHCTKSTPTTPTPTTPTPTTPKAPPTAPSTNLRKCFDDVAVEYRCVKEIMASFWFPSVSIDRECCKVVDEFNQDCSSVVYAPLQSPSLKNALKNYCSKA